VAPSDKNRFYDSPVAASSDSRDLNFTANVSYRLDDLTFGSTSAYQHEVIANLQDLFVNSSYFSNNFRDAFDAFIGPVPGSPGTWSTFYNDQNRGIDVLQLSQEFKIASSTDKTLSYLAGVFISDQRVSLATARAFTPALTDYNVGSDTKTYDVYGRGTVKFTDETSLIVGLRYNSDHLSYGYSQPDSSVESANSNASSAVVGDISLEQRFNPHTMVYISYARGYAPKVFNTGIYSGGNAVSPTGPLPATGQEHIDNFDIGTKGRYWDQRLMVNADLFDTEYNDYQVQSAAAIVGLPAPVEELSSAGKARTRGFELDTALAASDTLRIDFSTAYIAAEFVHYTDAPCWGNGVIETLADGCHTDPALPGQLVQDVSGKTMPDAPRFKETLGIEQRASLPGTNLELAFGGTYDYRTRAQFQPDQNPQTLQGGFGLLDLRVGLRDKSGKYSITAFCNNVTNHFYAVDKEDFWSSPWNANAVVMQPARDAVRYFGVRLSAGF
jgi:iron complex outermembrane receptor protein